MRRTKKETLPYTAVGADVGNAPSTSEWFGYRTLRIHAALQSSKSDWSLDIPTRQTKSTRAMLATRTAGDPLH